MSTNIFSNVSSNIDISNEALLTNLDKIITILNRVFVKNIKIFLKLFYYQSNQIFSKYNKTSFFDLDAGDVFNNFICLYPSAKNADVLVLIDDKDFRQVSFTFSEIAKTFSQIKILTEEYKDDYTTLMWECCKYLIVPIRVNYHTIPPIEKENVLRKWLSTAFTLPFFNIYTNRYSIIYPNSLKLLQQLYGILVSTTDNKLNYTDAVDKLSKSDDKSIDNFIGPLVSENNLTAVAIRTFIVIMMTCSKDIIKKYCPNIKECKQINPSYSGSWINGFDTAVSAQNLKIEMIINNISPK